MFKKILVPVDFSDSSRSAWFASISMAARCLAEIHLLHVYSHMQYVFSPDNYAVPDERWRKRLVEEMDEEYSTQLYPNSQRSMISNASVVHGILEHAKKEGCDFIVAGNHGRGTLGKFLLGSVSQQIIRNSTLPVMIVKATKDPANHVQNYNRILVPIDFSEMSMNALDFAVRFANFLRADIHLIHIVDLPMLENLSYLYSIPGRVLSNAKDLNVDLSLSKAIETKNVVGNQKTSTLFGDPSEEILKYAEMEKCGFIIMGTHGRKGFDRVLLGSVTSAVATKSDIPVITLSPMRYLES